MNRPFTLKAKHFAALGLALVTGLVAGALLLGDGGSGAGVGAERAFAFEAPEVSRDIDRAAVILARDEAREQRRRERLRELRPFLKLPAGVSRGTLEAIASCESGGDPAIVSSSGLYHGKYQFSVETWAAVGGSGLPSQAPELEQDYRAALLYVRSGPGQWPVCGS
jgi:hypothetical protein